jgi:hypothetical protein
MGIDGREVRERNGLNDDLVPGRAPARLAAVVDFSVVASPFSTGSL